MKNIYTNKYKKASKKLNTRMKIMIDIINNLNLKNQNILDIGCLDGNLLKQIKNKNNLYGIEASNYGFKTCQEKGIKVKQFFINDSDKIPFPKNKFDLVIIGEIIEHIYDTDFLLREIYRLLKPNGYLLLSTPNIASLGRRMLLLLGINPLLEISPNYSDSSGHIRYFTHSSLNQLIDHHKFTELKFTSDIINFDNSGKISSVKLAKIFPSIGQSLIALYKN
jgi:2-polyprenyl-3-methyl-5-hydroxy-6-metoxy-1,4-benzoquinol methylase